MTDSIMLSSLLLVIHNVSQDQRRPRAGLSLPMQAYLHGRRIVKYGLKNTPG